MLDARRPMLRPPPCCSVFHHTQVHLQGATDRRSIDMHPRRLLQRPSLWGRSSVGRAPEWHSGGRRFDPDRLHQTMKTAAPWAAFSSPQRSGSHLRLLVASGLAASGASVPPRCAGVPAPTTHPLRPPLAWAAAAPFGVIDPDRLHQTRKRTHTINGRGHFGRFCAFDTLVTPKIRGGPGLARLGSEL
jgi:hypothetical protein